jgi:hypothetical protein
MSSGSRLLAPFTSILVLIMLASLPTALIGGAFQVFANGTELATKGGYVGYFSAFVFAGCWIILLLIAFWRQPEPGWSAAAPP